MFSAPSFYLPAVLKQPNTSASFIKAQCDGIVLSQGLSKPSSVREGQRREACWLLLGWRQCPPCLVLLPATEHLDSLCFIKSGGKKETKIKIKHLFLLRLLESTKKKEVLKSSVEWCVCICILVTASKVRRLL